MKAQIVYLASFAIPQTADLQHAVIDDAHDILCDQAFVENGKLMLVSKHGKTKFSQFVFYGGQYVVPEGAVAEYEGAWRALNAVAGIRYPHCIVSNIKSSNGFFDTLEEYEMLRKRQRECAA